MFCVYLTSVIITKFRPSRSNHLDVGSDGALPTRQRSIVVRMQVSAGELSLSCARLLAEWVTTLWLSRPLSVSQHGQLSHPSLRGR